VNSMQRIIIRIGVLLLAICRTVYCWMFLYWSFTAIYVVGKNILSLARTHCIERGDIISNITLTTYSIVLGIAWWMIFRDKPALKQWAIAANLIFIFTWFPVLFRNWRIFLNNELGWWPEILVGIFGIIIFCIPYHGWRDRSLAPQVSPIRAGNE